eukprot:7447740-Ditylum_brightwellii.AAC.1
MWCLAPQQEHDQILMDVFGAMKPSTDTLEKLNAVCLYLGALALADITNKTGTYIEAWALSGIKKGTTLITWPNQRKPSKQ